MLENLHLNDSEAVARSIARYLTREWLHKSEKSAALVKNSVVRMQFAVKRSDFLHGCAIESGIRAY